MKDEQVVGRLSESYRNRVNRFDLVIFVAPQYSQEKYTKRVIGLPNEHISIDGEGVKIDGHLLALPSTVSVQGLGLKKCDISIPSGSVFVLGDNTSNSWDSRYLGPIPKTDLIGYLVFKK